MDYQNVGKVRIISKERVNNHPMLFYRNTTISHKEVHSGWISENDLSNILKARLYRIYKRINKNDIVVFKTIEINESYPNLHLIEELL